MKLNFKEKIIKINNNKYFVYLFVFFVFITWFILTHITKLSADDFSFKYLSYDNSKRIENLYDVISSQYYQYFVWGGRSIINATAEILSMYDKIVFDILNAIIFSLNILLIYSFKKTKNHCLLLIIFIFLAFWFCCGDLYRIFIWESACINYGWPAFFSLLLIKPYFVGYERNTPINCNIFFCVLFFIYSLLVGWGHEAISPVVFLSLLIYLIYKLVNKIEISKFEICGFLGHFIGMSLLYLAPGNFVRYNTGYGYPSQFDLFPFSIYFFALFRNAYFLIYYTFPIIIITIIVLYYNVKSKIINNTLTNTFKYNLFYSLFILLFASFFTFIMLSYATSIIITSLVIMLIIIIRYIDYKFINNHIDYFFIIISLLFLLFLLHDIATIYYCVTKGKNIIHGFQIVG